MALDWQNSVRKVADELLTTGMQSELDLSTSVKCQCLSFLKKKRSMTGTDEERKLNLWMIS